LPTRALDSLVSQTASARGVINWVVVGQTFVSVPEAQTRMSELLLCLLCRGAAIAAARL